jgi:predicted ATPase
MAPDPAAPQRQCGSPARGCHEGPSSRPDSPWGDPRPGRRHRPTAATLVACLLDTGAALTAQALVPAAVAQALGVREAAGRPVAAALHDHLREKRLLLLLDNCEHLVDACARLADALLRACPDLRVLATSREALGVAGETPHRVPSLALPDPARPPPAPRSCWRLGRRGPRPRAPGGAPYLRDPRSRSAIPLACNGTARRAAGSGCSPGRGAPTTS